MVFSLGAHGSFSFPRSYYPPKDGRAGGIASPFLALTAHIILFPCSHGTYPFFSLPSFLLFLLRTIMNRYGAYLAREHYVSVGEIVQQHSNGITSNVYDLPAPVTGPPRGSIHTSLIRTADTQEKKGNPQCLPHRNDLSTHAYPHCLGMWVTGKKKRNMHCMHHQRPRHGMICVLCAP